MLGRAKRVDAKDPDLNALVKRAKKGEAEAFGKIYQLLLDQIYRYVFFRVDTKETAEDLTQEVFVKAYQKLNQYNKGSLTAWVYTIARNTVIDYYRSRKQTEVIETANDLRSDKDGAEGQLNEILIKNLLERLPEKYREILVLRYVEDLSVEQVSKILKISEANTRTLCHRAIRKLREQLDQTGE